MKKFHKKIINFDKLNSIRNKFKNKKIVLCHGTFDFLHYGHFLHFKAAKNYGEILVASVTSDKYINKGPNRPFYNQDQRTTMLSEIEFIDFVVLNHNPLATNVIENLKPDYYVKGSDYKVHKHDLTKGIQKEYNSVKKINSKIRYTNEDTMSSTNIINKYTSIFSSDLRNYISKIQKKSNLDKCFGLLAKAKDLKVLVIGEPIIDTYIYCNPIGLSSKSPSISVKKLYTENFIGGSLAIANNLASLKCKCTLLTINGMEKYYKDIVKNKLYSSVKHIEISSKDVITPRKIRYVTKFGSQKIFEIVELSHNYSKKIQNQYMGKINKIIKDYDLLIISDFGHGLFENHLLNQIVKLKIYKCLNVQTNSENLGFNTFDKFKSKFDYLSIDERELRYALRDRYSETENLIRKIPKLKDISVTLASKGSYYKKKNYNIIKTPTFFNKVKDTTGSGDAYFSITSILNYLNADPIILPFIGNIYAGLSTQIVANSETVELKKLFKSLESIYNS